MDLVIAVASLGLAAVVSVLIVLGVRKPVEPAWASEGLVANVWCVAITGFIGFGISFAVRFFLTMKWPPLSLIEFAIMIGLLAAFSAVILLMAPRRRLAAYAAEIAALAPASNVVELAAFAADGKPPTNPSLPKAA